MTGDDELKAIFERAAEIAKAVPTALQESAFNRALDALLPRSQHSAHRPPPPSPEHPKRGRRRKATAQQDAPSGEKAPRTRRSSGRPGPRAALEELLQTSFWGQPRTIGQLQEHLRTNRGYTYKLNELSPSLVRLLRDKKVDRAKNKDGQYEYRRR